MTKHIKTGKSPIPQDKNDCTIRALSIAMEIEYMTAYGMILGGAGRKMKRGVWIEPFYDSLFPNQITKPHMIVETFIKYIAHSGNWIISYKGHAFAVINGAIHDTYPEGCLNHHVVKAWRVK